MRTVPLLLCAAAVVLAIANTSFGDIVHLKNGGKIDGLVSEEDGRLVVKTRVGTLRVDRANVLRIERAADVEREYQQRAAKLGETDADGHYQLGLWLAQKGARDLATKEFEKAASIDPSHDDARKKLGHVFHQGRWYTGAEAKRAGLVKYDGQWMTPIDAAKAAQKKKAVKMEKEFRRKVNKAASRLLSPNPAARAQGREQMLALAEKYHCPQLRDLADRLGKLRGARGGRPVTMEIRLGQTEPAGTETFQFHNWVNGRKVTNSIRVPSTRNIGVRTTVTAPGG